MSEPDPDPTVPSEQEEPDVAAPAEPADPDDAVPTEQPEPDVAIPSEQPEPDVAVPSEQPEPDVAVPSGQPEPVAVAPATQTETEIVQKAPEPPKVGEEKTEEPKAAASKTAETTEKKAPEPPRVTFDIPESGEMIEEPTATGEGRAGEPPKVTKDTPGIRVSDWEVNATGGISGRLFGRDDTPEGNLLNTAPIVSGTIAENNIVSTSDGESYLLGRPRLALLGRPVPVTVQGLQTDTGSTLVANRIDNLFEKAVTYGQSSAGDDYWAGKMNGGTNQAMRFGKFEFDDIDTGSFIYLPSDFDFDKPGSFDEIIEQLGFEEPDLTFLFKENWGVVPNLDQRETDAYHAMRPSQNTENKETWDYRRDLKYPHPHKQRHHKSLIETRVRNVIKALAEGCSESTAVFLMTEPHTGNTVAEMACEAANRFGVNTLGLFVAEDFSYVHEDADEKGKYGKEQLCLKLNNVDYDEYLSPEHKIPYGLYSSTHRWYHDITTFNDNPEAVVSKGDAITKLIKITTKRTKQEESFHHVYRHQAVLNGLVGSCTHRLVFEERKDKDHFENMFLDKFPCGYLCVGSGCYGLAESIKCLTNSRPLFVLKNTGATSNAVAELGYLGRKIFRGDFKNHSGSNLESSHRNTQDDFKDLAFLPKSMQRRAHELEDINDYIARHFPPQKGSEEAMHHFFPDMKACHKRDLGRELAIDDFIWDDAKVYAQTFSSNAPNFNPDTMEIFDVGVYIDVNNLQNRITEVMSSSFDHLPELGGLEKDRATLGQAIRLQKALAKAKYRYRGHGNILQSLVRLTLLSTTALTVVQSDNVEQGTYEYNLLRVINTIMPLFGSLFITLDSFFRPTSVYMALLLAEKRIESERYRFLTRTGEYRISKGHSKGDEDKNFTRIREKFSATCQMYFEECLKSDFSGATLFPTYTRKATDQKVFDILKEAKRKKKKDKTTQALEMSLNAVNDVVPGGKREKEGKTSHGAFTEDEKAKYDLEEALDLELDENKDGNSQVSAEVITADEYLEKRLKPTLVSFYRELPGLAMSRFWIRVWVISLTAATAAMGAFRYEAYVPLVLAAAGTLEFGNQFFQLDTRVPGLNSAAGELTKIFLWWNGITLIQSRLPSFKDKLVDRSEDAIITQYEQFAGSSLLSSKKREDKAKEKEEGREAADDGGGGGGGADGGDKKSN